MKCGVKLADTEKVCPLCKTKVYHPDILQGEGNPLYPENVYPKEKGSGYWLQVLLSIAFVLPMVIVFLCDMQFGGGLDWSGYVIGALLMGYVIAVLPSWFKNPNPVIFVPCSFLAVGLYLLYVNLAVEGNWFMSFAFPVVGVIALIVTTVVVISRHVKGGKLFLYGGASIALGGFMLLMEYLMSITFAKVYFVGWCWYPLVFLVLLGGFLIFLGICTPARETMERKFFI